ncbi:MAG: PIN domain-containing protein [Actinoallomurus sp.]
MFVDRPGRPVMLDTSALMEGELFTEFDWHTLDESLKDVSVRLILPSLVVEELDELKRHRETKQKTWARKVLRTLWGLHAPAPTLPARLPTQADVTVAVRLDDGWHQRMSNNDGEIIDQAVFVRELTEEGTIFVSADYTQLYRAAAVGLPVALMPHRGPDEEPSSKKK